MSRLRIFHLTQTPTVEPKGETKKHKKNAAGHSAIREWIQQQRGPAKRRKTGSQGAKGRMEKAPQSDRHNKKLRERNPSTAECN
jgi:hypothetical protein